MTNPVVYFHFFILNWKIFSIMFSVEIKSFTDCFFYRNVLIYYVVIWLKNFQVCYILKTNRELNSPCVLTHLIMVARKGKSKLKYQAVIKLAPKNDFECCHYMWHWWNSQRCLGTLEWKSAVPRLRILAVKRSRRLDSRCQSLVRSDWIV